MARRRDRCFLEHLCSSSHFGLREAGRQTARQGLCTNLGSPHHWCHPTLQLHHRGGATAYMDDIKRIHHLCTLPVIREEHQWGCSTASISIFLTFDSSRTYLLAVEHTYILSIIYLSLSSSCSLPNTACVLTNLPARRTDLIRYGHRSALRILYRNALGESRKAPASRTRGYRGIMEQVPYRAHYTRRSRIPT
jgi:hypothetical protein